MCNSSMGFNLLIYFLCCRVFSAQSSFSFTSLELCRLSDIYGPLPSDFVCLFRLQGHEAFFLSVIFFVIITFDTLPVLFNFRFNRLALAYCLFDITSSSLSLSLSPSTSFLQLISISFTKYVVPSCDIIPNINIVRLLIMYMVLV